MLPQPTMPTVRPVSCRPWRFFQVPWRSSAAGLRHLAQQRDHERQRELGDRAPVDARRPAEADAAPGHGREVEHVGADAVLADHLELGEGGEHRARRCAPAR